MAVEPVFNTIEQVKASCRLTGAAATDAIKMIEDAIQDARVELYKSTTLGSSLIATIKATATPENATTEAQLRRTQANLAEIKMIKIRLVQSMPMFFIDSLPIAQKSWNEENIMTPVVDPAKLKDYLRGMQDQIDEALAELRGGSPANDDESMVVDIGPQETIPLVGKSIWGS